MQCVHACMHVCTHCKKRGVTEHPRGTIFYRFRGNSMGYHGNSKILLPWSVPIHRVFYSACVHACVHACVRACVHMCIKRKSFKNLVGDDHTIIMYKVSHKEFVLMIYNLLYAKS